MYIWTIILFCKYTFKYFNLDPKPHSGNYHLDPFSIYPPQSKIIEITRLDAKIHITPGTPYPSSSNIENKIHSTYFKK